MNWDNHLWRLRAESTGELEDEQKAQAKKEERMYAVLNDFDQCAKCGTAIDNQQDSDCFDVDGSCSECFNKSQEAK